MKYTTKEEKDAYALGFDHGVDWAKHERQRLSTKEDTPMYSGIEVPRPPSAKPEVISRQLAQWELGASLTSIPTMLKLLKVAHQDLCSIQNIGGEKAKNLARATLLDWEKMITETAKL